MQERIDVLVFCAVYNHEKYLEKTLSGFVSQITNFDFKVFIHDDASTDCSRTIIEKYLAKYPNMFYVKYSNVNQHSKGVHLLETFALPYFACDYIAFCEGDDYWCDTNKLQSQYDALNDNPDCIACVNKVQFCDEDGTLMKTFMPDEKLKINKSGIYENSRIAKLILRKFDHPFQTSSYLFRSYIFDQDKSHYNWAKRGYDRNMLLNASCYGNFYYINKVMSVRRCNVPTSWTNKLNESGYDGRIKNDFYFMNENLSFDKYTNYVYHDDIYTGIYDKCVSLVKYNPSLVIELMKENNLSVCKMSKYLSVGRIAEFYITKTIPKLGFIKKRIKRKLSL